MRDRHEQSFLAGGGEMGSLIRAFDWGATPLGDPGTWPQTLKTAVRILLSTGHPMFLFWGPDLIQFYNDAYRRSLGPERHPSALGQRGRECWEEIWPIIGPQIEQVMAGEGYTWHENQLVPTTRHGRRQEVYWTYSYGPVDEPAAPNGVGGVLVVCTETTKQVISERHLKEAEARWRSMFDQAPGFMAILSGPDHVFEYANARYHELVGNRSIVGKPIREGLPEIETQGFFDLLDEVYGSGEPHWGVATPVTLVIDETGRKQRYLDFVYQPIRDAGGKVTGILVDGYDVTERVAADDALREEDRRKDEFLAMLAHELRNPLAPLSTASESLKRIAAPDSREHRIGEMIGRQVHQLSRLVDDLIDVSRITTGRIQLKKQIVSLRQIVDLAVESVLPLVRDKDQNLEVACPDDLHVEGDLARLVQAVSNILNNSTKYSQAGGDIRIGVERQAGAAVIEITDNGVGISPEIAPKIFDLFTQDFRTLDRSEGGLGIGLAVVRSLIRMHGGEVSATSDGVGRGSSFRVSLSLVENRAADSPTSDEPAFAAKSILVVDDNVDAADSLAGLLTAIGHRAEPAYNAGEALDRAGGTDAVLLDLGLPVVDGFEIARRLRAEGFENLIVAVTGYGQPADVERALESGFDAHLTKPVKLEALQEILLDPRAH